MCAVRRLCTKYQPPVYRMGNLPALPHLHHHGKTTDRAGSMPTGKGENNTTDNVLGVRMLYTKSAWSGVKFYEKNHRAPRPVPDPMVRLLLCISPAPGKWKQVHCPLQYEGPVKLTLLGYRDEDWLVVNGYTKVGSRYSDPTHSTEKNRASLYPRAEKIRHNLPVPPDCSWVMAPGAASLLTTGTSTPVKILPFQI
jgi:hypothetical protein